MTRMEVLQLLLDQGLMVVFNHPDPEVAVRIMRACEAGGARLVEHTHRGEHALRTFQRLAAERSPATVLGVGTVHDAATAALYLAHGARFVVAPILDAETVRLCNRRKVAVLPGCGTASEVAEAEALGVEVVKLFPRPEPFFVRALLGPNPWTRVMVTGDLAADPSVLGEWIRAGAACFGMGSALVRREWVERGDFDAIAAEVKRVLGWIREARRSS